VKPTREDILQEQAKAALAGVPNIKVQQCMYFSMSSLNTSPVRVYVETDFCKIPKALQHRPANQTVEAWKLERAAWKAEAQRQARVAIGNAMAVLEDAMFQFEFVTDYGWAQLTITGGAK
jgi:hypothetical protein